MVKLFPYLPVVKQAILTAQPRPSIIDYDQASLAISSAVYRRSPSRSHRIRP